ncbi:MAG: acetamidase/formamidase family protein [Verrucomicrobiota bacterium]
MKSPRVLAGLLGLVATLPLHAASADRGEIEYDHYLPSKWNTVTWGIYSSEYPPAVKVKSGAIVKIDIANPIGTSPANPKKFFTDNGIPLDLPVVKDILEIREKTPYHPSGLRGALLTGPVYIEGAEPGDSLEVRVLDIRFRAPYGINMTSPGSGHPLADLVPRPWSQKFDLDFKKNVAIFKPGAIELPLAPFMGQMGVAPPPSSGAFGANPPTAVHGGTFDLQELCRGGTLYLPVNVPGALFFTGNGHALQGNGELTNPSLEVSLTGYFQFIVHKKKPLKTPWIETPTHYIFLGLHDSLDECMRQATLHTVEFLQEREKLDFYDAYALASTAVDFTVARALLPMQMVYSFVPKHIFKSSAPYWYEGPVPVRY